MKAHLINEELSRNEIIYRITDDIFGIWDEFEENRDNINWYQVSENSNQYFVVIEFLAGYYEDFKKEVNEYLKKYKIKNFGGDYPIEWEWDSYTNAENSLIIKTI